ncbi:MAG: molybdopterin dinucleotide-binding protein [Firmicutes bacterium]|nr:molybdopterin dinucleotide-binding protein [Bacillota bacterium]
MKRDQEDSQTGFMLPKEPELNRHTANRTLTREHEILGMFRRRGTVGSLPSSSSNTGVQRRYTVCLGCRNHCGIAAMISEGILEQLNTNPYHPASHQPHALYETPLGAAGVWQMPSSPCPEISHRREIVYDPMRVNLPLKRLGSRGSGAWEVISWEQLIQEVVEGGKLFAGIAREKERSVPGFASVYDQGINQNVPMDPLHPDMGPRTNALVIYMGEKEEGPRQFIDRFARSFGTANVFEWGQIRDENRQVALRLSSGTVGTDFAAEKAHAEFILGFGWDSASGIRDCPQEIQEGYDGFGSRRGLKRHQVNVRTESLSGSPDDFTGVRPGGDGALAMGIIRWILDNHAYDGDYLMIPSARAAQKNEQPNFTNAAWLVNVDGKSARKGKFLTAREAGLVEDESPQAKDSVVLDFSSQALTQASLADRALLTVSPDFNQPLRIKGIHCRTAFQVLWQEAHGHSLQEYAQYAGVSVEVLESLAHEFSRHGKQAVAEFFRGPAMHTNGVYTARAIFTLNLLIGNVDWIGGLITGGTGADLLGREKEARYHLDHWPGENSRVPYGVNLSRTGVSYENTSYFAERIKQGQSPYPALRPWFPFSRGLIEEMFAGLYQGYPYHGQIVVQYRTDPEWSAPAIGGGNESLWAKLMTDLVKVPLFIAIDTRISESSRYADYIVPDTVDWEGWGFSDVPSSIPTKAVGVRSPVVKPLIGRTPENEPMSMEQFFIDVAKRLQLPGFGPHAFFGGGKLDSRAQYYLKMLANLAYDSGFLHVSRNRVVSAEPVPDGRQEDMAATAQWQQRYPDALREEEWDKVAYVLARGGRFEDYLAGYEPGSLAMIHRQELPVAETLSGLRMQEKSVSQYWALFYPPSTRQGRMWVTHRFGTAQALQIYSAEQATTRNALTGARFLGTGSYQPLQNMTGQHLDQADFVQGFPFILTSRRKALGADRLWTGDEASEIFPPVDMNPDDAERNGLKDGERVRVISASFPRGVSAKIRLWPGIREGVLSFVQDDKDSPESWTRQEAGNGQNWKMDGGQSRFNALIRRDGSLAAGPFWSIALEDPLGGGCARYETRVRIERLDGYSPRNG